MRPVQPPVAGHEDAGVGREIHDEMVRAFREYATDVKGGIFPAAENSVAMEASESDALGELMAAKELHKNVFPSRS